MFETKAQTPQEQPDCVHTVLLICKLFGMKPLGSLYRSIQTVYLGLNEIYVWFLLPTYPIFSNPTLNIKMVFGEKIPKMGTFSDFVTIFFVKCYNKI